MAKARIVPIRGAEKLFRRSLRQDKIQKTEKVLDALVRFSYKKALHFEELHLKTVKKHQRNFWRRLRRSEQKTPLAPRTPPEEANETET